MRGDIISMYKYRTGDSSIVKKLFSERKFKKSHGLSLKLEEKWFNSKLHRGLLTVRVVRGNYLSQAVVSTRIVDSFKELLDVHLNNHNIQVYTM